MEPGVFGEPYESSRPEFETIETIKMGELASVERVRILRDGSTRIQRIYRDDKREVFRTLSSINSRYIPHIERVDFSDCCTTVIEQDIDGALLSERMISHKPSKKEVLSMTAQLLTALSELHRHSVIHRDIKPDNIMVTKEDDICLIDFGISRIYRADASRDTSLFGTVGYAAPEQYGFSQTDPRSDLYSAGIVIRELCEAAGLSERDSLYKIAERCSTFDPNRRYKSADAALAEIKSVRKKPLIAAFAALLIIALTAVISYQYLPRTQPDKTEEKVAEEPTSTGEAKKLKPYKFEPILKKTKEEDLQLSLSPSVTVPVSDVPWILLYQGENMKEGSMTLKEGEPPIDIAFELKDNTLVLMLSDGVLPEQKFIFQEINQPLILDYPDSDMFGELLLYDLDHDGRREIFVILNESALSYMSGGRLRRLSNWTSLWCVGYVPGKGFWSANNWVHTKNDETIDVDFQGSGNIWLRRSWKYYTLENRDLVEHRP